MKTILCTMLILGLAGAAWAADIRLVDSDGKKIGPIRTTNGENVKIGDKTYTVELVEQTRMALR